MAVTQVNGFQCRNCTDIDYAKKHIDPARPKDGPYGIDAKDPARADTTGVGPAVLFGGRLSALSAAPAAPIGRAGLRFDLSV